MATSITRRDFLDGVALAIAAGLAPLEQVRAQPLRYPPALTGLRGQHPGSFEVAHALVREGRRFSVESVPVEEHHDLVVVGGGISGLAAAYFFRRARPEASILILDNHDDFGGHAKRNEFRIDDRLIIGYGGSESLQSPNALFSKTAKDLLAELGVDLRRFETAFERTLYSSLGLSRGLFFSREAFGRDALVAGDSTIDATDEPSRKLLNAKPWRELVAAFPVSDKAKAQLIGLKEQYQDPLPDKSEAEKRAFLSRISYRDYLMTVLGCVEEVANVFHGRTHDFFGLGCDAVPALAARDAGYPGFAGLNLPAPDNPELSEPYIYHFPDGNASLARLLVRALIPGVAPGRTMDDIVLAPFDYARLDEEGARTRIRLDSTCVHVRNRPDDVEIGYVRTNRLHRITADRVVLACFATMIPYIMPELPEEQRRALALNVKTPLIYTKVLVRNWHPWVNLGVHDIAAPMSFHTRVKLDYPVSLGDYRHPRDPSEPMCLHLSHVATAPNRGLDAREQWRIGRMNLLKMTYEELEERIRDELDRMLGPGGFSSARDILAITVNRWSHGYAYTPSPLFDGDRFSTVMAAAKMPAGRVAIANSDTGWDAYAHVAIDEAHRAVGEILAMR
jgi:spermidine dehydrogenase